MGRALITSYIGAGQYNATLLLARSRINAKLAAIATEITDKADEIAELEAAYQDRISEFKAEAEAINSHIEKGEEGASGDFSNILYDPVLFVNAHNVQRTAAGKPTLSTDSNLMTAAQTHADYLKQGDIISHVGRGRTSTEDRAAASGYSGLTIAENLSGGAASVLECITTWMEFSNTRTKILSEDYTDIGVGFGFEGGASYGYYWVAMYGGP